VSEWQPIKRRGQIVLPIEQRLTKRSVATESGCIEWQGSLRSGYGGLVVGSRSDGTRRAVRAHRAAYECWRGPIPEGMYVCHTCDNRRCITPDHLFLGTAKDNFNDMANKGRNHPLTHHRGERHTQAKISDALAAAIRDDKRCSRLIAKEHGINDSYVRQIKRGMYRAPPPPEVK